MARGVEGQRASFSVVAARQLIPLMARWTRFRRRTPRPSAKLSEAVYGPEPRERMTVLSPLGTPPASDAGPRPAVVYIHGGGWIAGNREEYTPYLDFLAQAGYTVFNLGYPLAPENPHPGILRSLLAALDWIADQPGAPSSVHIMGDSAGGNLAAMLGLLLENPELLAAVDPDRAALPPLRCASIVSIYGVLDRLTWIEDGFPGGDTMLENYAGAEALGETVPPAKAITPMDLDFTNVPPTLLTVGTEDALRRSSQLFADRLRAGSSKLLHIEYPGEPHGFFHLVASQSAERMSQDILAFLESI